MVNCVYTLAQNLAHSPHVKSVVEWSATWSQAERKRRPDHFWKVAGTSFDIAAHFIMATAHLAWFVFR